MQLSKWALLFIFVVSSLVSAYAGTLKIEPSSPTTPTRNDPGTTEIKVTYFPDNAEKNGDPQKFTLEIGFASRFWPDKTKSIPLIRDTDGNWKGTLEREAKEFWPYLIFQVKNDSTGKIDTNNDQYWDVVFCNPNGERHFQGVQAQADSYTGFIYSNGIARKKDFGKALSVLKEYMDAPTGNNFAVLSDYWNFKIRSNLDEDSAWESLSVEIKEFADEHRSNKGALARAFEFVQENTDHLSPEISPLLLRYVDALDPALAARLQRMAAVNSIQQEKDLHRRADAIRDFVRKYPNDPNVLMVVAVRFELLRDFHDVAAAEEFFAEREPQENQWADLYASMAAIYIENNQKLDQALKLLDKAEQLGVAGIQPPEKIFVDYAVLSSDFDRSKAELSYWRARAYLAQNHGDLALPLAIKAAERRHDSQYVFLVGQAYEAIGEKQKAIDTYFEALLIPSTYVPEEQEKLTHLWVSGGFGTKETLEQKLRDQQDELFRKANYTPRLVDRPVPDYEFATLKQEKIKSSDLRDRIAVLNFWGVWCIPCLPELPGFQELQRKHPEIFVAAVALSSNPDKVKALMAKEKLDTLRIGQNDKLEESFASSGVPITYVIDHGRIRVVHQDAISNVIAYIEADLTALKKETVKNTEAAAK